MILLAHLLFGAAISLKIEYFWLALILAFFSHYFLDLFPHTEYPIENIKNNQWRKSLPDFLRVVADFVLGILIIFLVSENSLKIYICALTAVLPDMLTLLNKFLNIGLLKKHDYFHLEKIHFLKDKKIPQFWRFLTQIVVIVISILLLKS